MFGKLPHVVTSELTQGALPFHSCWIGSMALLYMVLQSLGSSEVYGTEWTLVNMGFGMLPKFCYHLELLIAKPRHCVGELNHLKLL